MASTASDFLLQRLHDWGIRRIYGYPGDGINGIMGALDRARERIQFVQARHEEMAAFMACAPSAACRRGRPARRGRPRW
jgi:pyruvate dehydrogenase (quinone)